LKYSRQLFQTLGLLEETCQTLCSHVPLLGVSNRLVRNLQVSHDMSQTATIHNMVGGMRARSDDLLLGPA
jgi:hypothetical protein